MESFFATLKTEFFYLNEFASVEELQRGLLCPPIEFFCWAL